MYNRICAGALALGISSFSTAVSSAPKEEEGLPLRVAIAMIAGEVCDDTPASQCDQSKTCHYADLSPEEGATEIPHQLVASFGVRGEGTLLVSNAALNMDFLVGNLSKQPRLLSFSLRGETDGYMPISELTAPKRRMAKNMFRSILLNLVGCDSGSSNRYYI